MGILRICRPGLKVHYQELMAGLGRITSNFQTQASADRPRYNVPRDGSR